MICPKDVGLPPLVAGPGGLLPVLQDAAQRGRVQHVILIGAPQEMTWLRQWLGEQLCALALAEISQPVPPEVFVDPAGGAERLRALVH